MQLHSFQDQLEFVSGEPHVPTPLTPRERARLTHDAGGPWIQKIWATLLFFPCMLYATPISSDKAPKVRCYEPLSCPFCNSLQFPATCTRSLCCSRAPGSTPIEHSRYSCLAALLMSLRGTRHSPQDILHISLNTVVTCHVTRDSSVSIVTSPGCVVKELGVRVPTGSGYFLLSKTPRSAVGSTGLLCVTGVKWPGRETDTPG